MKTTIEVHADDYLQELERIQRTMAMDQCFPEKECAICGANEGIALHSLISQRLQFSKEVPVCRVCTGHLIDTCIEDFFRKIKQEEFYLWSQIVTHNIRKNTWISRLAFDILKE
ncbi:MAG: hypothetical protein ACMUHM_01110 [Thermoplasmatota archaeon]